MGFISFGNKKITSTLVSDSLKLTLKDLRSTAFTVAVPSSVVSIGDNCFYGCSGLTSITIPASVTSLGSGCFRRCAALTTIVIPPSVSELKAQCFQSAGLTSITIPDSVTSLGPYCFGSCTNLTSITIPDSVTSLGLYCFDSCTNLSSVKLSSSLTTLTRYCFRSCFKLLSIIIPPSVISLEDSCFFDCSLTNVYFTGCPPTFSPSDASVFLWQTLTAYTPSPATTSCVLHLSAANLTTSGISAANGVKDISGRGNHGQASGGVAVTTDTNLGNCFNFADSADTQSISGNLAHTSESVTVSIYYKRTGAIANRNQLLIGDADASNVCRLSLYVTTKTDNNLIQVAIYTNNAIELSCNIYDTYGMVTTDLHLYTATYDADTSVLSLYIDDKLAATKIIAHQSFAISKYMLGYPTSSYRPVGLVVDARIYGKALSPTEVSKLYKSVQWIPKIKTYNYGSAEAVTWATIPPSALLSLDALTSTTGSNGIKDISGNNYHGTLTSSAVINKASNGFVFDGATNSKVEVTNSTFLSKINGKTCFTLSMAVKCTDTAYPRFGGFVQASGNYFFGFLYFNSATSVCFGDRMSSSSETIKSLSASTTPLLWHTYTVTVDYTAGEAILYIDGKEASRSKTWFKGTKANVTALRIGQSAASSTTSYLFRGSVKNITVYNRVLTEAEVAALHDNTGVYQEPGISSQIAPAGTATSATYAIANALYMRHGTLKKLVVGDYGTTCIKIYDLDGTRSSGTYTDFDYSTSNIDIAMAIAEDDEGYIYITGANTGYIVKLQVCSRVVNGQINYYLEKIASMRLGSLVAANQVTYCKARDAIIVIGWSSGGSRSYCFQISKDFSSVINIANWSMPSMGGCFTLDGKRLFLSTYSSNNRFGYIDFSSASDTATKTSYTYADTPTGYSPNINSGNNDARYATAGIDGYMYFQMLNGSVLKYTTDGQYVAKIGDTGSVPTSGSYSTPRHDGVGTYDEYENALVYPKADGTICRMYL